MATVSKGYGGWFAVILVFIALRGAADLFLAVSSNTAINYLVGGLMMVVLIAAFVPSMKPHFRIVGSVILIGRSLVNFAILAPYFTNLGQAGPALLPNLIISLILPAAAGLYIVRSARVRATMIDA